MSNEKEILKKLIKIAHNQQKIINKLAQDMIESTPVTQAVAGWDIKTDQIQVYLDTLATKHGVTEKILIDRAHLDKENGQVTVGITVPKSAVAAWPAIANVLDQVLTRANLADTQGQTHKASSANLATNV